jgi:WD40 repeat protein
MGAKALSLVTGNDKAWQVVKTSDLESPIVSVSVLNNKAIVRTIDTSIHVVNIPNLSRRTISKGTVFRAERVCATKNAIAIALGENGLALARIERSKLVFHAYDPKIKASALSVTPIGTFVCGCADGSLVSVDDFGAKLWGTERVHRGRISAVATTAEFIATGGEDGLIRVITHKSRSLINEMVVHNGPVLQILPAFGYPQRIHSVSTDRTMTTTDVSTGKRVCQQLNANRIAFTGIAQFTDGETEILVSMGDGSIRGYDWPRQGIVLESGIPQKLQINTIALKPQSRLLICGGESEYLSIGDFATGEWKIGGIGHSTPIRSVVWTTDGQYVVSAADDGIGLWTV